jgi:hypothetical protein
MGCIGYFMFEKIMIISTSLCGSFCSVFGVGMVLGEFPDIYDLAL